MFKGRKLQKINQQIDKEFSELFGQEEQKMTAAAQPLRFKRTKNPQNIPENISNQPTQQIPEQIKPVMQQPQQQQAFHMTMKKDKQIINPQQQELISKKPFNVKNIRQGSANVKNDRIQELEKLKQQQGNIYQKLGLAQQEKFLPSQNTSETQQQNTPNSIAYTKPNLKPSKEAIQAAIQKNQNLKVRKEMKYEQGKITEEERLLLIQRKKQQQQQQQQQQMLHQQQQIKKKKATEQLLIEDDDDYSNDIKFEDESEEELVRPSTAVQKFQFKPKQEGEKKQFHPIKDDPNKNLEEQNNRRKKEKELAYQRAKQPISKGLNRNELREINQDIPAPKLFENQEEQQEEEQLLMAPMQKKKKGMMLGQKVDEREIVFSNQQEQTKNSDIVQEEQSEKAQQQRKRCQELRHMVFLEEESFGDILAINPTGQYEQYVNRIKKEVVKNFAVQCNDDNVDKDIQTEDIDTDDFVNQCPEDRIVTFAQIQQQQNYKTNNNDNNNHNYNQKNNMLETPQLNEFVSRVSPVLEELLDQMWVGQQRQGKNFRDTEPSFQWLDVKHPEIEENLNIRFIYSMDGDHHNTVYLVLGTSTIIEFQSRRITRGFKSARNSDPISSLHRVKYLLFSGTESGGIEIFDLRNTSQKFFHQPVWDNCIVSTFQELQSNQDSSRVVAMRSQVQNNGIQLIVLQQFARIEL